MPDEVSRRQFIRMSAGAAAFAGGGLAVQAQQPAKVSANDKIVMGFIGTGGRGRGVMGIFKSFPDVEVAAVCDVYEPHLNEARKIAGERAAAYKDYRRILERKDIDAVMVATTGHWHALPSIHACEAGKDVYVEKPLATTVAEGRAVVNAARQHDRVCMIGTQQRSTDHYHQAYDVIKSGALGTISMVRTWNCENQGEGFGNPPDGPPPPGLDWNFWLGPAPRVAYNPNRQFHHYWFWDYGGGWESDWAVHHYDIVHWYMGLDTPLSATASGGKLVVKDNRQLPDTLEVVFEYPGFIMLFELRCGNARPFEGKWYGCEFHGSNGTLIIDREGFQVFPEGDRTKAVEAPGTPGSGDGPHQRNFLDCVRSRRRPFADIEVGHKSSVPGHLANIAYRVKRKIRWDAEKEQVIGDAEANQLVTRQYRKPWAFAKA